MAEPTKEGRTPTLSAPQPHSFKLGRNRRSWRGLLSSEYSRPRKLGVPFLFFGVGLPVLAVLFELSTHYCARNFFDPFPSSSHIVLFSLIPLSNFLVWLAGRRDMSAHYGFMCLISGMAMGIGILYALMFLPITAQAAMYTLVFGIGLLGFAPLLSIPCSWMGGKTACHLASARKTFFDPHQVEHIGHLIVLCLVVAVELPSTLTRINLGEASDPSKSGQAVSWLRQYGSEEVMLRACYERSGRATDILGSLYESAHPLTVEAARAIFFKVTGKPFNTVPIPASARGTIQHAGLVTDIAHVNDNVTDEFDLDADIAGETVSGVARGLSISQTKLNAVVNADAAVAELSFAFELKNVSQYDREARAKVQLPPGAVVTGAYVTVNGVEHEAKIMVRDAARQEYRQSVSEHKNPLLVSMSSAEQVLVQCFPVLANNTMMVRLTIAAPLVVSKAGDTCALQLPTFVERNFQFDAPLSVNLRGAKLLNGPIEQKAITKVFTQEGQNESFNLASIDLAKLVDFERDPKITSIIAPDTFATNGMSVERNIFAQQFAMPKTLTVVVDGSASMAPYLPQIAEGLRTIPESINTTVVVVGDQILNLGSNKRADIFASSMDVLAKYKSVGGQADGVEVVRDLGSGPVLWIHGAQPFNDGDSTLFTSLLNRSSASPMLYDFVTAASPNELLNGLQPTKNFVSVARVGTVSDDLRRLTSSWQTRPETVDAFRAWAPDVVSVVKSSEPMKGEPTQKISPIQKSSSANLGTLPEGKASSKPVDLMKGKKLVPGFPAIAQLYGYQQLLGALGGHGENSAMVYADQYHLVSPVSSAVVVDEVPATSIPEPTGGSIKDHVDRWYKNAVVRPVEENLNSLTSARGSGDEKYTQASSDSLSKEETKSGLVADVTRVAKQKATLTEIAVNEQKRDDSPAGSKGLIPHSEGAAKSSQAFSVDSEQNSGALSAAPPPSLNGATNGTIGPLSATAPPLVISPSPVVSPPAIVAPSPTSFPFIGQLSASNSTPPVDPRYGQSMEQASNDTASNWLVQLGQAVSIFGLVFLTMFAGIKLLNALSLPKDY